MPPGSDIGAVRQFLRDHVESYEQLEILLLLVRAPGARLTIDAVAEKLTIGIPAAKTALDHLCGRGLLDCSDPAAYGYAPGTPELRAAVDNLVQAYEQDRFAVMERMSANVLWRRNSALRAFSDAFRLRGPKKDG